MSMLPERVIVSATHVLMVFDCADVILCRPLCLIHFLLGGKRCAGTRQKKEGEEV